MFPGLCFAPKLPLLLTGCKLACNRTSNNKSNLVVAQSVLTLPDFQQTVLPIFFLKVINHPLSIEPLNNITIQSLPLPLKQASTGSGYSLYFTAMEGSINTPLFGAHNRHSNERESVVSEGDEDLYAQESQYEGGGGGGNFFSIGTKINWTHADHSRLQSIDELHTRLLEYHNNVHARGINGLDGIVGGRSIPTGPMSPIRNVKGDVVAQVMHFSTEYNQEVPCLLNQSELVVYLDKQKIVSSDGSSLSGNPSELLWIHAKNPSVLGTVAGKFEIHDLCFAGFSDLRAFSSFIPVPGAVFMSFCTFLLDGTNVNMFKVFCYVSKNLVITFEREIMPDLLAVDGPMQDNVCASVMAKYHRIRKNCAQLGGVHLMYILALEGLALHDSIVDFFSRTLYYFKQKVTTRQYHKQKLRIAKQMHMVSVAVVMIKNSINHSETSFVRLLSGAMTGTFSIKSATQGLKEREQQSKQLKEDEAAAAKARITHTTPEKKKNPDNNNNDNDNEKDKDKSGSGGLMLVLPGGQRTSITTDPRIPLLSPIGLLLPEHTPYLLDLVDSYKFTNHLLNTELEEVQALTGAMDALTTLRSINTSTLLSFVATIFLPLNFLTGVFGTLEDM